jgi:hypothetical protein
MQRILWIAAAAVNAVGLVGCGAESSSAGETEHQASSWPTYIAPSQAPTAMQSYVNAKQIGGVSLFWHPAESYGFRGLLQATPRIDGGCLKVGDAVVVWDEANLSVAEDLLAGLQAGQVVGEVSLGGGVLPDHLTLEIRQQCASDAVVYNNGSRVSVVDISDD